ncbi:ArsR family transcriptional regulator [Georgenia alba]|uniref:ArsR family transcriptional regulator n=1 Tax=Georgenia alba TaxID=2233858 RepID=A0ABW2Q3K5_9MICO
MTIEASVQKRAALHAALAGPGRLRVVDALALGDASPGELAEALGMTSNLLAHHLKILQRNGLVRRGRSEGDGRRSYLRLVPEVLDLLSGPIVRTAPRVLFVCTGNSARSQLAAALWRTASAVPATSAGTRPAPATAPGAVAVAERHGLDLGRTRPRHVADVHAQGDLVVTVCDRAHEELDLPIDVHWSVANPGHDATAAVFDATFTEIEQRVNNLAPRVTLPANRT